jgi:hypothetical protein
VKATSHLSQAVLFRIPNPMEVDFTPEQYAQIAQLALKAGTDPEHLVKNVVLRVLQDEVHIRPTAPELPILHLGTMGAFHRRDIYDRDV